MIPKQASAAAIQSGIGDRGPVSATAVGPWRTCRNSTTDWKRSSGSLFKAR